MGLDEDSGVSQHKLGYPLGFYTKLQSQNTIKQLLEPTIIREQLIKYDIPEQENFKILSLQDF